MNQYTTSRLNPKNISGIGFTILRNSGVRIARTVRCHRTTNQRLIDLYRAVLGLA